jgi:integrase
MTPSWGGKFRISEVRGSLGGRFRRGRRPSPGTTMPKGLVGVIFLAFGHTPPVFMARCSIPVLRPGPLAVAKDSPFVFPATRGRGHFTNSKKIWSQARERAGLPNRVRYHARHAMASLALSEGVDVASVAAMMGHKSARTTLSVYAHVIDSRAAQAANSMGDKINLAMKRSL